MAFSTCVSNFCGSCPHPVKSGARRSRACEALPLVHFPLSKWPSRFNGIRANTFLLALFHELAFLLERGINSIINPPACKRVFGAAEEDLSAASVGKIEKKAGFSPAALCRIPECYQLTPG